MDNSDSDDMRKRIEEALEQLPIAVQKLLGTPLTPCCDNPAHRTTPQNPNDWAAVDNMMRHMFNTLFNAAAQETLIMFKELHRVYALLPDSGGMPDGVAKELKAANVTATVTALILSEHFDRVSADKRKELDAQMHYPRIIGAVARMAGDVGDVAKVSAFSWLPNRRVRH